MKRPQKRIIQLFVAVLLFVSGIIFTARYQKNVDKIDQLNTEASIKSQDLNYELCSVPPLNFNPKDLYKLCPEPYDPIPQLTASKNKDEAIAAASFVLGAGIIAWCVLKSKKPKNLL